MKTVAEHKKDLTMRNIFKYMMENGYNPVFEDDYITFNMDDNTSVLELNNDILTIRTFFTIDEEEYDIFLEASNYTMLKSDMMKPVIMEDMKSIMFSCETLCENTNDFKRFFPRILTLSKKGLETHKNEMRELIQATSILKNKMPASEDSCFETGTSRGKLLS